ncbi:hypothetical protein Csa_005801 [Cucumis sativus]|uniref:Uncharacterized protein n=1 Tax=Cucumis sativus TaxID=3659 RepID=A0A0A0KP48_CUCSA|nr:hypothetical protein Csa_005801 [Cucumis sativus]
MDMTIALSNTFKSDEEKRLLVEEDGMDVLNGNNEARVVKATKLNFPQPMELEIDSKAIERVKNLVVLKVRNGHFF